MRTTQNQKSESGNRHALRAGFTLDEVCSLTKIDRWFLVQLKEIVDFEEELATVKN
jgi:carbamoyl-phosphate synthase large subunit